MFQTKYVLSQILDLSPGFLLKILKHKQVMVLRALYKFMSLHFLIIALTQIVNRKINIQLNKFTHLLITDIL